MMIGSLYVEYGNLSCDYVGLHCEDKNDHSNIQFSCSDNKRGKKGCY